MLIQFSPPLEIKPTLSDLYKVLNYWMGLLITGFRMWGFLVPKSFIANSVRPLSSRQLALSPVAYLWLVGNGRMVVMVLIIVPIPPFPTNQR